MVTVSLDKNNSFVVLTRDSVDDDRNIRECHRDLYAATALAPAVYAETMPELQVKSLALREYIFRSPGYAEFCSGDPQCITRWTLHS